MELINKDRYYQDIKVGDTIEIIETQDTDLELWCEINGYIHFITELDSEAELVWVQDCPYAIDMADFVLINCKNIK